MRTYIKEAFEKKGKVELYGWVHDIRDLSKVRFIVLKDITGRIQCVGLKGKTNDKTFNLIGKITRESVLKIKGEVKVSEKLKKISDFKDSKKDEPLSLQETLESNKSK